MKERKEKLRKNVGRENGNSCAKGAPLREGRPVAGGGGKGAGGERLTFCPPLIIADPFPKIA